MYITTTPAFAVSRHIPQSSSFQLLQNTAVFQKSNGPPTPTPRCISLPFQEVNMLHEHDGAEGEKQHISSRYQQSIPEEIVVVAKFALQKILHCRPWRHSVTSHRSVIVTQLAGTKGIDDPRHRYNPVHPSPARRDGVVADGEACTTTQEAT